MSGDHSGGESKDDGDVASSAREEAEERAWNEREESYRAQIAALEEEQVTLRDAWSEIVRGNMAMSEDLKKQLNEATRERDLAREEMEKLKNDDGHDVLASSLAEAKLRVAQLSEQRDLMHQKLVVLLREFPT